LEDEKEHDGSVFICVKVHLVKALAQSLWQTTMRASPLLRCFYVAASTENLITKKYIIFATEYDILAKRKSAWCLYINPFRAKKRFVRHRRPTTTNNQYPTPNPQHNMHTQRPRQAKKPTKQSGHDHAVSHSSQWQRRIKSRRRWTSGSVKLIQKWLTH